ncbi:iron transporter [Mangrovihabitans endophyticus]|uniref:Iron transporter n=1 Tax=Mangrovihabitans endophyticus TaxID=1751298 RepID=A0A8J3C5S3_9ACTN|nr:iron transporter [Mangrovihabitans endophyticus]
MLLDTLGAPCTAFLASTPDNGWVTLVSYDGIRFELRQARPGLLQPFDAALPGARSAVLARLFGALIREPLPGLLRRSTDGTTVRVAFTGGRSVVFPADAGLPFAPAADGLHAVAHGPDTADTDPDGRSVADPAELARLLWPGARLSRELADSVINTALARADRAGTPVTLRAATGDPDGLGRLEQRVVDGHPLHPCCRTRLPMSIADVLAYGPEHRPVVRLRRLRVPAAHWAGDGPPVLYAHPWQASRLLAEYGWLADDGPTAPVRPLMSLRTLAPLDGGDHVKTAVDVQMTSAVRTVSPAAVHNGPRLSALLRRLTADLPLTVLAETSAGAVTVGGVPQRRLAYLRRQAPRLAADEVAVPLAVLAAGRAAAGERADEPLIVEAVHASGGDPHRWFADLARVLWPPLCALLERGVALEAHGQNTLVVLVGGRPVRTVYRDLGGVRVDPRRHDIDLRGDLAEPDPAARRAKLAAAALSTVATELVDVLCRWLDADPDRLWRTVAGVVGDPALRNEPLPIKAMTAMRLAPDPLRDIWTHIANPMAACS